MTGGGGSNSSTAVPVNRPASVCTRARCACIGVVLLLGSTVTWFAVAHVWFATEQRYVPRTCIAQTYTAGRYRQNPCFLNVWIDIPQQLPQYLDSITDTAKPSTLPVVSVERLLAVLLRIPLPASLNPAALRATAVVPKDTKTPRSRPLDRC